MKKRLVVCALGLLVVCSAITAKAKRVDAPSLKVQLTQMVEDQLDLLDTAIGFAKKSHEKFNKEDEDYLQARNLSASDKVMKSEHDTNVEIKNIVDPSNVRAMNTLLPLSKNLTGLDFYKQLSQKRAPKSKKAELLEKNNARIDRYLCGASMIDEKIERLDDGIKKIQALKSHNIMSAEEKAACNALVEVKRVFRDELKHHKKDMYKAVRYLKKHRKDLE